MKTNIIPFVVIAIVGIFAVVIVSQIGVNQREEIQLAEENGGEVEETEEVSTDPEESFANSCASCHGADLTGGAGPDLTAVGADYSQDEINEIITNGLPGMPAGLVAPEQAEAISEWLSEKK